MRNTVISYKMAASDGMNAPELKTILLRDIADIYDGYKDVSTLAYLDGEPCVLIMLQKQSGKNSVQAARRVDKAIPTIKAALPTDIEIVEVYDTTDAIEQTIGEVVNSVIVGAILAVLVLIVFLRSLRSTIIIALAIPVSVMITLFAMYFMDITINMVSTAGLLLGIGMLVDNSIVVLENIFSYRQKGTKSSVASVLGAKEMITSITASTLTSVCIFLPMLMFKKMLGIMGQMFNDLAWTIIFSLMSSLIVAIALVPALTSRFMQISIHEYNTDKPLDRFNRWADKFFDNLDIRYSHGVKRVLRHRKLVIFSLIGLFIVSFAVIKVVGFIFMPEPASNMISIDFALPKGTPLDVTENTILSMQAMASQELKGVKYTMVSVGGTSWFSSGSETNAGRIVFSLYPVEERQADWDNEKTAKEKLRKYFTMFPGADLSFSKNMNSAGSGGMSIDIKSDDLELVRSTATQIEKLLKEKAQDYVTEVASDVEDGLPQAEIIVDRDRMYELGLNVYGVGSEITAAINGTTASRYTKNGDDIDILVRMSERDKTKLADLDQITVVNSQGQQIPLSSFAHYEQNEAPVTIFRESQARIAHVTAKPASGKSLDVIQKEINKLISDNIPQDENVLIAFSGDYADMMEAVIKFGAIIIMAAFLVFVVMASQFESLIDPFIVIMTIPLSFIGVFTIYLITQQQLSVITIMGLLVLVGTIVNNGIVLVDYTNLLRKRGYSLEDACVEAARSRLRPILMSTLTTVISLAPMAFFPGEGSASMQPISLTVFGGMTFGSLMTLFLMPTVYYIVNNHRIKKAAKKEAKARAKALAARNAAFARGEKVSSLKNQQDLFGSEEKE